MSKIHIDLHSFEALASTEEEEAGAEKLIVMALHYGKHSGAKAFTLLLAALETFARMSDQPELLLELARDCMSEELRDPAQGELPAVPPSEGWQDKVFEAIAAKKDPP